MARGGAVALQRSTVAEGQEHGADVLELRDQLSFNDWTALGRRLARVSSASAWALGDWLLYGERNFARRYRTAVAATDLDYQTLRNYAWVARAFSVSRRRDSLSFQHHVEVAVMTEAGQELWLNRAEAGHWSRNELRRRIKASRRTAEALAGATAVVLRVELAPEDEQRWSRAAALTELPLLAWLHSVADAAADSALDVTEPVLDRADTAS